VLALPGQPAGNHDRAKKQPAVQEQQQKMVMGNLAAKKKI